jgi:hypothetical protein
MPGDSAALQSCIVLSKTEADQPRTRWLVAEWRQWYRSHAVAARQFHAKFGIRQVRDSRVVGQLKIGAGGPGEPETRSLEQGNEPVAALLVEGGQAVGILRLLAHEIGNRVLHRRGDRKGQERTELGQRGAARQ